jgi:hypothetical protein
MTWDRTPVAAALVDMLTQATEGAVTVFDRPPTTLNPPALVVSRVERVTYAVAGLGVDDVTLPVLAVGPMDGDDQVSALADVVRLAVLDDRTIEGSVHVAWPLEQRNWRNVTVAGVDLLTVEVVLSIQM